MEKDERVHESESTLLVNGHQVHLEGQEGSRIRECLLRGVMPDQQLINHIVRKLFVLKTVCFKT